MAFLTSRGWVWIVVIAVVGTLLFSVNRKQNKAAFDGKQAHDYLCYQKDVVIPSRINSTLNYERQVQLGERTPIPGITVADLTASIKRDQDALKSLNKVKC